MAARNRLGVSKTVWVIAVVATTLLLVVLWFYARHESPTRSAESWCSMSEGADVMALSDEDCTFIAVRIPVLPRNTQDGGKVSAFFPSSELRPGMPVPERVGELKDLPQDVVAALPQLEDYHYFLSGQNIVLVGKDNTIALTIDVRRRPRRSPS